uniref:Large ribosomal subunit protein bL17c n=1 Tax=Auxenochlorella protothecoides TaxID=3075 RepID=A0A1D1ZZN5_AUXPR
MKHRVAFRKLRRSSAHRWAMLRTMVSQLVEHERIETTLPKAKELRRVADQVVTLGKEASQHARRQAMAILRGDAEVHKVFSVLAQRYSQRDGGYTRVLRTQQRGNDAAQMAFIEFVDRPGELRPARPGRPASLLPPAAQLLQQQQQQ